MKLGIRNLKYVPASKVRDYGLLPPGSVIDFSSFLDGSLQELPFTMDGAEFSERWSYDDNGKYSDVAVTVPVRAGKESWRDTLQQLTGRRHIFLVELVSGVRYVVGSPECPATFTFSDGVSGISSSGFTVNISCRSLHGAFIDA